MNDRAKTKAAAAVSFVAALGCAALTLGCQKPAALTRESVRSMIEASEAFRAPIDPGIVFVDTTFRPGPNTRRQFAALQGMTVKPDGPFGVAGSTATVVFTWSWSEGPLAGRTFQSKARLNSSSGAWKVYDDYLQHELWTAERGNE